MRVSLVDMPGLIADLVQDALESQPGIQVVSEGDSAVDVLITGAGRRLSLRAREFLRAREGRRVITITAEGRAVFLYDSSMRKQPLGELSPMALVEAVAGRGLTSA